MPTFPLSSLRFQFLHYSIQKSDLSYKEKAQKWIDQSELSAYLLVIQED